RPPRTTGDPGPASRRHARRPRPGEPAPVPPRRGPAGAPSPAPAPPGGGGRARRARGVPCGDPCPPAGPRRPAPRPRPPSPMPATPAPSALDVQAQRPTVALALSRVGVAAVQKVIRVGEPGAEVPYLATFETVV